MQQCEYLTWIFAVYNRHHRLAGLKPRYIQKLRLASRSIMVDLGLPA